jgi:hypothetical protein
MGAHYDGEWENGMYQGLGLQFSGKVIRKGIFHQGQYMNA